MEWGGGVIGWQEDLSQYNSHYISGRIFSNEVGCQYSSTVVFKIDDGKVGGILASLFLISI